MRTSLDSNQIVRRLEMATTRRASIKWTGDLMSGKGLLGEVTSGAFSNLPMTWASRTEAADGRTSPEELLAAAHAGCFSMALSSELAKAGSPPQSLDVTAEVAADRVDGKWTVVSSKLTVRGRVPGLDQARFRDLADAAKNGCPISRAIQGNVALSVEATLEG
jgi:osmotically inducible protein OsmC